MAKAKILVVEDDDDLRRAMLLRLGRWDYDVVQAQDGIFAVSVARKERPDLVLLDIGLPGGDGLIVLERLRNLPDCAVVPVIILTGRERAAVEPAVRRFSITDFLSKPVDRDALAASIERALGGAAPLDLVAAPAPAAYDPWTDMSFTGFSAYR